MDFGKRRQSILAVLGMACMWPALHNQSLYPLTLIFHKEFAPSAYSLYLVYVAVLVIALLLLCLRKSAFKVFENPSLVLVLGAAGIIGITLVALIEFGSPFLVALLVAGLILYAIYVPFFFIFWSLQVANSCHNVPFAMMISYAIFAGISALRIGIGIHVAYLTIVFTLMSVAFAAFTKPAHYSRSSNGKSSVRALPLNILLPSFVFVLLCASVIAFLNPAVAAFDYPPSHRMIMYAAVLVIALLVAIVYFLGEQRKYRASFIIFLVLSMLCVGCLILSGVGRTLVEEIGNYPVVGARILLEAFIWTMIISTVHTKHISIALPALLYIGLVLSLPNLIVATALNNDIFKDPSDISLLVVSLIFAFAVVVISNVIMAKFLLNPNAKRPEEEQVDPLERAFTTAQNAFELSERQMDIVRLAYKNWTSSRIGQELFISEGTVKTHLKMIYKKANVHSKQELIDIIDAFREP